MSLFTCLGAPSILFLATRIALPLRHKSLPPFKLPQAIVDVMSILPTALLYPSKKTAQKMSKQSYQSVFLLRLNRAFFLLIRLSLALLVTSLLPHYNDQDILMQ
jgi:hypothetical protein